MAARPKDAQKVAVGWNIDKEVYDNFIKACTKGGWAPQIVAERLIRRFNETGQM